jgi:hypothetical protein
VSFDGTIGEVESWYRLWRLCEKLRESRPGTVGGYHSGSAWDCTLRRSVLSIARGQWKDRNSVDTCSPTTNASVDQIGHSLRSDGSFHCPRAIERTFLRSSGSNLGKGRQPLCRLSMKNTTHLEPDGILGCENSLG